MIPSCLAIQKVTLYLIPDKWTIDVENTIGLFGERNHMLLDTLIRAQGGVNEWLMIMSKM